MTSVSVSLPSTASLGQHNKPAVSAVLILTSMLRRLEHLKLKAVFTHINVRITFTWTSVNIPITTSSTCKLWSGISREEHFVIEDSSKLGRSRLFCSVTQRWVAVTSLFSLMVACLTFSRKACFLCWPMVLAILYLMFCSWASSQCLFLILQSHFKCSECEKCLCDAPCV